MIEPYAPEPIKLAENLWVWDGEWGGSVLRRRMTIVRLTNGALCVHSAIQLQEADYAKIDALGRVQWILVPNAFHSSEAHHYRERYPDSKLLVVRSALKAVRKFREVDGILPDALPAKLREELDVLEVFGTRMIGEIVLLHRPSKTLIVTDLAFNMQQEQPLMTRLALKANHCYRHFGPSRIFKHLAVSNRKAFQASVERMFAWEFVRVVMSHGDIVNKDGKARLRKGFEEIGLLPERSA